MRSRVCHQGAMQQEDSPKCWASDTKGVWIVGKAKKHIATDAVVALDLLSLQ